jgi:CHAT domain-containing protein
MPEYHEYLWNGVANWVSRDFDLAVPLLLDGLRAFMLYDPRSFLFANTYPALNLLKAVARPLMSLPGNLSLQTLTAADRLQLKFSTVYSESFYPVTSYHTGWMGHLLPLLEEISKTTGCSREAYRALRELDDRYLSELNDIRRRRYYRKTVSFTFEQFMISVQANSLAALAELQEHLNSPDLYELLASAAAEPKPPSGASSPSFEELILRAQDSLTGFEDRLLQQARGFTSSLDEASRGAHLDSPELARYLYPDAFSISDSSNIRSPTRYSLEHLLDILVDNEVVVMPTAIEDTYAFLLLCRQFGVLSYQVPRDAPTTAEYEAEYVEHRSSGRDARGITSVTALFRRVLQVIAPLCTELGVRVPGAPCPLSGDADEARRLFLTLLDCPRSPTSPSGAPETFGQALSMFKAVYWIARFPMSYAPLSLLSEGAIGDAAEISSTLLSWSQLVVSRQHARPVHKIHKACLIAPAPDLPGAVSELDKVSALLVEAGVPKDGIARIDGPRFSRRFVREHLRNYQLVHYAGHSCHGMDDSTSILPSCDGNITIDDLLASEARPTLVFINACNAGNQATGPYGNVNDAAAAFVSLGAQHVVAPLTPVSDVLSASFGGTFYAALQRGHTVGYALRASRNSDTSLGSQVYQLHGASNSIPFPKS